MGKFLKVIGGIVILAAIVAGATYAVLKCMKKCCKDNDEDCCFIDVDDYEDDDCCEDVACDCGCGEPASEDA